MRRNPPDQVPDVDHSASWLRTSAGSGEPTTATRRPAGTDWAPAVADPSPSPAVGPVEADEGADRPRRPPGPSVKPAAFVFGLALLVFVGGAVALGLSGSTAPQKAPPSVPTAPGAVLRAVPATTTLKPLEVAGQPPTNIIDALAVPAGTVATSDKSVNLGVETYDRSMSLSVAASQAHVIDFFRAELKADGWQQISSGPQSGGGSGIEVLGQHAGSDGNTWEVGVVVQPTTFGSTGSAATVGTTPFSLEVYIVNTDD